MTIIGWGSLYTPTRVSSHVSAEATAWTSDMHQAITSVLKLIKVLWSIQLRLQSPNIIHRRKKAAAAASSLLLYKTRTRRPVMLLFFHWHNQTYIYILFKLLLVQWVHLCMTSEGTSASRRWPTVHRSGPVLWIHHAAGAARWQRIHSFQIHCTLRSVLFLYIWSHITRGTNTLLQGWWWGTWARFFFWKFPPLDLFSFLGDGWSRWIPDSRHYPIKYIINL